MTDIDKDTTAILAVHDAWFKSNVGLVVEDMLPHFPQGESNYLQFNLNGFTYNGVADKAKLWRNLAELGVNITRLTDAEPPQVHVYGDVAWLTTEAVAELVMPTSSGTLESSGEMRIRETEVYRRDDGAGNARWTIWHMHVSEAAASGGLKYGNE
ncbi:SnoaL-like domain-containing protein [Haloechinothrix alba]|uniref:SnoaL-like domain-containing protein n=1 Tax=Haloechinothrix alba TaxID=664784 RepID=A0A238ZZZ8_9PSEU|nr:nuclear transport factor 2 family protein [Haloechinothrix alba]SNR88880.1 SnoaL-like domain-containing protein [Haloechinothrix alba]